MDSKPCDEEEKRNAQQHRASKIRELKAFYRALAKDQEALICQYRPDGTLAFVNERYCRYFGKSSKQLVDRPFMPLMPDSDRKKVMNQMTALTHENPVSTIEHRVIMPNGEIRWLRWTFRMVFDEDNRFVGYQASGRDITKGKTKKQRRVKRLDTDSNFAA